MSRIPVAVAVVATVLAAGCLGGVGGKTWYVVEAVETGGAPVDETLLPWDEIPWGSQEETMWRILREAVEDGLVVKRPLEEPVWSDLNARLGQAWQEAQPAAEPPATYWISRGDATFGITFDVVVL